MSTVYVRWPPRSWDQRTWHVRNPDAPGKALCGIQIPGGAEEFGGTPMRSVCIKCERNRVARKRRSKP